MGLCQEPKCYPEPLTGFVASNHVALTKHTQYRCQRLVPTNILPPSFIFRLPLLLPFPFKEPLLPLLALLCSSVSEPAVLLLVLLPMVVAAAAGVDDGEEDVLDADDPSLPLPVFAAAAPRAFASN